MPINGRQAGMQAACLELDRQTDMSDVINGCLQFSICGCVWQEQQLEPVAEEGREAAYATEIRACKDREEKARERDGDGGESGRCRGASAKVREREEDRGGSLCWILAQIAVVECHKTNDLGNKLV